MIRTSPIRRQALFQNPVQKASPQFGHVASPEELETMKHLAREQKIDASKINPDYALVHDFSWIPFYNLIKNVMPDHLTSLRTTNEYTQWLSERKRSNPNMSYVPKPFMAVLYNYPLETAAKEIMAKTPEDDLKAAIQHIRKVNPKGTAQQTDEALRQEIIEKRDFYPLRYQTGPKQILKLLIPTGLKP